MTMLPAGFALLSLLAAAEAPPAEVRLPLADYDALRREAPSVTVVDTVRLAGSFRGRDLVMTLAGRASGRLDSIPVLTAASAEAVALSGCDGEALVSRAEDGAFLLTPIAPRFTARCRLVAKGSDRLTLTTTRHVLAVESAITDGELIPGPEEGAGERTVAIVRLAGGPRETLEATATGRYRLTLRPGEARFRYVLEVHNPNRTRRAFDVAPSAQETVQQVDSEAPWDLEAGRYRFDLPPGDTTLVLSGTLPEGKFAPPVRAAVQYVLLESHPLLRPVVNGNPKRVSPAETGVSGQFRGAQAFLLGDSERLSWTATALEAKRTAGYAVSSASHVLFLPASGPVLGESSFGVDNQGAPDLTLPLRPDFTFAALDNEPVFLTKNAEGNLWLPIGQGAQAVVLQHTQKAGGRMGFALGAFELPALQVPASRTGVEVRFPSEWVPLYASFASESRIFSPGVTAVVAFLFLFLCTERALGALGGSSRGMRLVVASVLAVAGLTWGVVAVVLLAGAAFVAGVVAWPWLRRQKTFFRALTTVGVVLALGVGLLVGLSALMSRGRVSSEYPASQAPASAPDLGLQARSKVSRGDEAGRVDGFVALNEQEAGSSVTDYAGLPARIQIPSGESTIGFRGQMLGSEASRRVSVVAVSSGLVDGTLTLLTLAALAALWLRRRALREGLERRLAAARAPVGATEPTPAI